MVKVGSKWAGTQNDEFYVIHVIELDGHTWVHYRKAKESEDPIREYSCYEESFLQRFRELPE
jgi:hypothetical protein